MWGKVTLPFSPDQTNRPGNEKEKRRGFGNLHNTEPDVGTFIHRVGVGSTICRVQYFFIVEPLAKPPETRWNTPSLTFSGSQLN